MNGNNKYHVRAIRNELYSYVRNALWNKFRRRWASLEAPLAQAVVLAENRCGSKHRPRKSSLSSLLHVICRDCSSSVPVDVLELVLQACPKKLHTTTTSRSPTPLCMAMESGASHAVIRALVRFQVAWMYIPSPKCGNTPILTAVRQHRESVVRLLLQHDTNKHSLLMGSQDKKQRVPLWYVADRCDVSEDGMSEELEYILLETHQALEMQQGRVNVDSIGTSDENDQETEGFFSSASSITVNSTASSERRVRLLQASIACAHLLGPKHTIRILQYILQQIDQGDLRQLDTDGNTLLHYACRATETVSVLELMVLGSNTTKTSFLEFLIAGHPQALLQKNVQGQLPLHLAIFEARKGWDFHHQLCHRRPDDDTPQARQGHLALYLAILHKHENIVLELWKEYPEAALIVDGPTGLMPFALAACAIPNSHHKKKKKKKRRDKKSSEQEDRETDTDHPQVSLIYSLLRASPQVIGW